MGTQHLARLQAVIGVSYSVNGATMDRLARYVALLEDWQHAKNLVSKSTLDDVWERHIIDSAQLLRFFPDNVDEGRSVMDLGSGAGFPGLVLSIILAEQDISPVQLVEANGKKCAFLKTVSRETGVKTIVHNKRIENLSPRQTGSISLITARAFAPLETLLTLSKPWLENGAKAVLLKGQSVDKEIAAAAQAHTFRYSVCQSAVSKDGTILTITMGDSTPMAVTDVT